MFLNLVQDRCRDYFGALKKFGLRKIFEKLPESTDIRREFLQEHLLPAAYLADQVSGHTDYGSNGHFRWTVE